MNAKFSLVLLVCFVALCLFGCKSQPQAQGPKPPAGEAKLVYPLPEKPIVQAPSMAPVYFATNSTQIRPQGTISLDRTAEWLKENPGVKVEISGNADQRDSKEYNQELGQKRADAVKGMLVQQGVSAEQLQTRSYGKDRPVCTENTDSCNAFNRRVDLRAIG